MDLRNLNTFIQVAELSSFTRAAEKLGYSQPTISFQIKQMEQELGIQLFERIGHTVCLTDDGRVALSYAQQILHLSHKMSQGEPDHDEPSGLIRIAMADSLSAPFIVRRFSSLRKTYPKISLKITTAGTDEMFRLLDHNEVDIVCTLDNHIYSNTYIISSEETVGVHFVCSVQNPLANKEHLRVEDLLSEAFLLTEKGMSYRRYLDEYLAQNSIELHPAMEIGNADQICRLVEENSGISLLPDYVTASAVKNGTIVRLNVEDFKVELWKQVLYHRDKWMSVQLKTVLDYFSTIHLG